MKLFNKGSLFMVRCKPALIVSNVTRVVVCIINKRIKTPPNGEKIKGNSFVIKYVFKNLNLNKL